MNSVVSFEPVLLPSPQGGTIGRLVFRGDCLMAILIQDEAGRWRVQVGFGPCTDPPPGGFATLQEASVWVTGVAPQERDRPDDRASATMS